MPASLQSENLRMQDQTDEITYLLPHLAIKFSIKS